MNAKCLEVLGILAITTVPLAAHADINECHFQPTGEVDCVFIPEQRDDKGNIIIGAHNECDVHGTLDCTVTDGDGSDPKHPLPNPPGGGGGGGGNGSGDQCTDDDGAFAWLIDPGLPNGVKYRYDAPVTKPITYQAIAATVTPYDPSDPVDISGLNVVYQTSPAPETESDACKQKKCDRCTSQYNQCKARASTATTLCKQSNFSYAYNQCADGYHVDGSKSVVEYANVCDTHGRCRQVKIAEINCVDAWLSGTTDHSWHGDASTTREMSDTIRGTFGKIIEIGGDSTSGVKITDAHGDVWTLKGVTGLNAMCDKGGDEKREQCDDEWSDKCAMVCGQ